MFVVRAFVVFSVAVGLIISAALWGMTGVSATSVSICKLSGASWFQLFGVSSLVSRASVSVSAELASRRSISHLLFFQSSFFRSDVILYQLVGSKELRLGFQDTTNGFHESGYNVFFSGGPWFRVDIHFLSTLR